MAIDTPAVPRAQGMERGIVSPDITDRVVDLWIGIRKDGVRLASKASEEVDPAWFVIASWPSSAAGTYRRPPCGPRSTGPSRSSPSSESAIWFPATARGGAVHRAKPGVP